MNSQSTNQSTRFQNFLALAKRLTLATLCGLLLTGSVLAQEPRPEERPAPEQPTPAASPAEKPPDPNAVLTPAPLANQSVDGDIVFTSPGQFTYPRDIRLSDNFGGLRLYGANALTTSPAGAAIQTFGNNATPFAGQLYLDSGALNTAALIFRTAQTGGTITERMRVMADGRVGIGTTNPFFATLRVVNNGTLDGVIGETSVNSGIGVDGFAAGSNGTGVVGRASGSNGIAVHGFAFGSATLAGRFTGNVVVTGTLTKGSGSFKIDHPLDPANKYLSHSFVESPDMMNIYNGNVVLDGRGRATIIMPPYFEALNREFRYQLTAIGAPGPNLYVAAEIKGNTFKVAGGKPGMKVSWLVTGVRHDAYAEAHRIQVEEEKSGEERGTYLHPEAFGQPAEKGVMHAQHPAVRQRPKEDASRETTAAKRTASGQR